MMVLIMHDDAEIDFVDFMIQHQINKMTFENYRLHRKQLGRPLTESEELSIIGGRRTCLEIITEINGITGSKQVYYQPNQLAARRFEAFILAMHQTSMTIKQYREHLRQFDIYLDAKTELAIVGHHDHILTSAYQPSLETGRLETIYYPSEYRLNAKKQK